MDAVNDQAVWDEATGRVMAYFTALKIGGVEHRTRETLRVITLARAECLAHPNLPPVEAAMNHAVVALERWYEAVRPGLPLEDGITSTLAVGVEETWPNAVLSGAPPTELVARLAGATVATGPDLALSSMAARDMNFGAMETIAQETWQKFDWAPVLRAAAIWTAIFFLSLYLYDRFFTP